MKINSFNPSMQPSKKSETKLAIQNNVSFQGDLKNDEQVSKKKNHKKIAAYSAATLAGIAVTAFAIKKLKPAQITEKVSDEIIPRIWVANNKTLKDTTLANAIEEIIKANTPKDEKLAREVLPTLIKHDKELQIGGHYERFLGSIDEENKEFAMKEVVPLLAKNYKKMGLSDSYNNNKFMRAVTPDNIKYFQRLADVSNEVKIGHSQHFRAILQHINPENEKFIFEQAIPTIIRHQEKMLNPDGIEVETLVKMLTPENINKVFNEDLPMVLANTEKLKIKHSSDIVASLEAVDKCGQNYIFDEILPILNTNEEILKLNDSYDYQYLMSRINPESKDKLLLIIQNAKKLNHEGGYKLSSLMSKPKEEILQMIQ